MSPLTCLAITAALEHFTAVFAETLLGDERAQALLGSTEVRSMLLWHAIEESEHRSVAFDVYRAAGGTERRRIAAMRAITVSFSASTSSTARCRCSATAPPTAPLGWPAASPRCGTPRF